VNRPVLVGVLLVAALLVVAENWIYFRSDSDTGGPQAAVGDAGAGLSEAFERPSRPEASASIAPPAPLSRVQLAEILLAIDYERSPFLLGGEQYGGVRLHDSGLPRLAGTLVGNDRRIAWMDGRPRREGEYHGEFLVSEVDAQRVVLVREGRRYTLGLLAGRALPEETPDPNTPEATPDPAVPESTP
jgi:hypothetical protein